MTEGDVSAREQESIPELARADDSLAGNLPGQFAIVELLRHQESAPVRSPLSRVFGISPLTAESKPCYDAAVSEIEVGDELALLDDEWIVVHALPLGGGGDIDHLVVGPGGVFIINTRNHPGQTVWASQRAFLVAGIRHPYIRNMEYEMGRAERLLSAAVARNGHPVSVEVAGILAIVAAKSITVREKHRDVTVLPTPSIAQWLTEAPRFIAPADVVEIGRAARLESTWTLDEAVDPAAAADPVDRGSLAARFAALRAEVRSAWRLQVFWATATTLVGAGGFVLVTYSILVNALASLSSQ
jgi:hypothetical protein